MYMHPLPLGINYYRKKKEKKGTRTVKSVNLAHDVLYNEVNFYIASITSSAILLTCNNSPLCAGYGSSHSNKVRTTVQCCMLKKN